uniref:Clathrin light chain n=1 Tax=Capra hircus TaxID=9925 RepID=A0A8C2NWU6_CAPHI
MADDFGFFSSSESGAPEAAEEDPAAAFLAQQESEIAGIENDEGFGAPAGSQGGLAQPGPASGGSEDMGTTVNGDVFQEANGPADGYAAIAQADRLTQEPESIRKWREEQRKRLQELDAASKVMEQEWREKAKKDLEEWNQRQSEQVEKNKINNRKCVLSVFETDLLNPSRDKERTLAILRASEEAFVKESKEETPGTEWEKVAQLCDFNPKSSKQCKDVSRLRSVLMSLKQTPLSR